MTFLILFKLVKMISKFNKCPQICHLIFGFTQNFFNYIYFFYNKPISIRFSTHSVIHVFEIRNKIGDINNKKKVLEKSKKNWNISL